MLQPERLRRHAPFHRRSIQRRNDVLTERRVHFVDLPAEVVVLFQRQRESAVRHAELAARQRRASPLLEELQKLTLLRRVQHGVRIPVRRRG